MCPTSVGFSWLREAELHASVIRLLFKRSEANSVPWSRPACRRTGS